MATKNVLSTLLTPKKEKTRLTVKYDCGFSNYLTIRGSGTKELSWNQGIPLKNIKPDEWVYEFNEPVTSCEFKILINDEIYECGDNHLLTNGKNQQVVPHF